MSLKSISLYKDLYFAASNVEKLIGADLHLRSDDLSALWLANMDLDGDAS